MVRAMLSIERLRDILEYDAETGVFTWRKTISSRGVTGREAGTTTPKGYRLITIQRRGYYGHRLAWFYMTGVWPDQIDHKNLNRSDNRWCNLRQATRDQNNVNKSARKASITGLRGVRPGRHGRDFEARIRIKGRVKYLGTFKTLEEASAAYGVAARALYGEFARW